MKRQSGLGGRCVGAGCSLQRLQGDGKMRWIAAEEVTVRLGGVALRDGVSVRLPAGAGKSLKRHNASRQLQNLVFRW